MTEYTGTGAGVVNAQFGAKSAEKFILRASDEVDKFYIESHLFPNVFLRLDGRNVTSYVPEGSGIVNAQFTAKSYEKFVLQQDTNGRYTIQSALFPNALLRIDGRNVKEFTGSGSGVVNAQYGPGVEKPYAKFIIHAV